VVVVGGGFGLVVVVVVGGGFGLVVLGEHAGVSNVPSFVGTAQTDPTGVARSPTSKSTTPKTAKPRPIRSTLFRPA
jgi:hypothetical protein